MKLLIKVNLKRILHLWCTICSQNYLNLRSHKAQEKNQAYNCVFVNIN